MAQFEFAEDANNNDELKVSVVNQSIDEKIEVENERQAMENEVE